MNQSPWKSNITDKPRHPSDYGPDSPEFIEYITNRIDAGVKATMETLLKLSKEHDWDTPECLVIINDVFATMIARSVVGLDDETASRQIAQVLLKTAALVGVHRKAIQNGESLHESQT